jgi:SCP-2 sterol transfer family
VNTDRGHDSPAVDASDAKSTAFHLLTRRYFLRGAGSAVVGTTLLGGLAGRALAQAPASSAVAGRVFADAEAVYASLGKFVETLVESNGLGTHLRQLNKTVLLDLTDPDARIYASLFADKSRVEFGQSTSKPKTTLRLSSDTAHELFLGTTNWSGATSAKQLRIKGDFDDLGELAARLHFATPVAYRGQLVDAGRADLVEN